MTKQWNGMQDGLPPVGEVIEALWSTSGDVWLKTIVFAFNEHGQPIHRWEEGPKKHEYQASPLSGTLINTPYFRPIRTPEQIAADEREKEIDEMWSIHCEAGYAKKGIAALYDAGYRKRPDAPVEDISDWRNWKVGDLVEVVSCDNGQSLEVGEIVSIVGITPTNFYCAGFGDTNSWFCTHDELSFHYRPPA